VLACLPPFNSFFCAMQLEEPWGDGFGGAIASSPEQAVEDSDGLTLKLRGKSKAKAKGKPRNPPKDAKCFVLGCDEKKAGKHRWCHPHKRTHDTLKRGAAESGPDALKTLEESCEEAAKAKELFDDFENANPGGKWARKKMVDWAHWKRKYGRRVEETDREKQVLMDAEDFVGMMKKKRPHWTTVQCIEEWDRAKANAKASDIEGEGANAKLWVAKNKQRFIDHTRFIEGVAETGSKAIKDPSAQDVEALKQFAGRAAAHKTDAFFRFSAEQADLGVDDGMGEEEGKKKRKKVENQVVSDAGQGASVKPKKRIDMGVAPGQAQEQFTSSLATLENQINVAVMKGQEATTNYSKFTQENPGEVTAAMLLYKNTFDSRMSIVNAWRSGGPCVPPAITPLGPGLSPTPTGGDADTKKIEAESQEVAGTNAIPADADTKKSEAEAQAKDGTGAAPVDADTKKSEADATGGSASPFTPSASLLPQQRSMALRRLVTAEAVRVAQDPSALMCQDEMKGLADIVLTKTDVESLEKLKSQFAAAKAQAEQIKEGLLKAASVLANVVKAQHRANTMLDKKRNAADSAHELNEVKRMAK